jgi:DNA-binding NtrC family response regulator
MSAEAMEILSAYDYPGNVRELKHVVERSRLLARGSVILPDDLPPEILPEDLSARGESGAHDVAESLYRLIAQQGGCFWEVVHKPFLRREISRTAVRHLIEKAKLEGGGSFKGAARILGIEQDHKKLLNFLRYHKLRPTD